MIIKFGTKYYKVEKEMTLEEVNEYKAALQAHYDTLDARISEQVKKLEDEAKQIKTRAKQELDRLKSL